jgi:hypothetical protein
MSNTDRITHYILKRSQTTLHHLEGVVVQHGLTLTDLYTALDKIHRDKRVQRKVLKGEIHYLPATIPKTPTDHLAWVRANYPPMTPETDGSGLDIDLSWMFLKTKEEQDAFRAEMTGRPVYLVSKKKKWQHQRD